MRLRLLALLCVSPLAAFADGKKGKAEHVVVVVWDGLRPDFVNQANTPVLATFARSGVVFKNHHAVYPSSTNVNGAVFATGVEPGHNGIIANQEFRPEIDPQKPFDTADFPALDAADAKISSKYLAAPTIAELIQKAGFRTAIAGSKPVAQLFDLARQPATEAGKKSVVIYRGKVKPRAAEAAIVAAVGAFPVRKTFPNDAEDNWTTRALTKVLWKEDVPKFSLLWLSEPDLSEHATTLGSPTALAAMKCSDANLAKVLAALRTKNALTTTDIFVVSDHGFSTVDRGVDVSGQLRDAGFDAVRDFASKPKTGQILVVSLGGSVEFYVVDRDETVIGRLIDFLQRSDFAAVILSRQPHTGTFTLAQAQLDSPAAPDVMVACRWNNHANEFRVPGQITSDVGRTIGHGTHSSLSPYDMHSTLIASGPDFRRGWTNETPSGNIDLAPTILWILGLKAPHPMDGRVLREALAGSHEQPDVVLKTWEATRDFGGPVWRQHLRTATVDGVTYLLEGDGSFTSAEP